jgi:hypothetical protein
MSGQNGQLINGKPISKRMARKLAKMNAPANGRQTSTDGAQCVPSGTPTQHRITELTAARLSDGAQEYTSTQVLRNAQEDTSSQENSGVSTKEQDSRRQAPRERFLADISSCTPSTLPRGEFVKQAAQLEHETNGDAEEFQTLFVFLRALRAHPDFAAVTVKDAWKMVNEVVRTWRWPDSGQVGWQYFGLDAEDAEAAFYDKWPRIRTGLGEHPLLMASIRARTYPVALLPKYADQRPEGYVKFIGLCAWLQVPRGKGGIIFLPIRRVAAVLKVSPMTISRYVQWAIGDGYLVLVNEHVGHSKAAEYTFRIELWTKLPTLAGYPAAE